MGVNPHNTGVGVNSENARLGGELTQVNQGLYSLKGSSDSAHCLDDVSESMGTEVYAYQRMVAAENNRKLPSSGMVGHDTSYSLAYMGYKSWVLHLADWWVILLRDLFELVVSVKLNLQSQSPKLLFETGFNQVDGTVVDSELSLTIGWWSQPRRRRL